MAELTDAQRALVENHLWLVGNIARKWRRRIPPSVEFDDLTQAGYMGLINAAQRFDAAKGTFRLLATYRVHGAIVDYLRSLDTVSKNQRRQITDGEAEGFVEFSHDEHTCEMQSTQESPEEAMMALEFAQQLRSLTEGLTGRQRTIIQEYYYAGRTMRDIGSDLGCGEPRVCQINKAGIQKLRESPEFQARRMAFRYAMTSGLLSRLGSAALALVAVCVLTASSLAAQTRVTTSSLAGTPGASPRVWVVLPDGKLAEADLENITLVILEDGKPVLRATLPPPVQPPTVVKTKHVLTTARADYPLSGTLDAVHRNGLLQAEGDDYTIVAVGGVSTLRFNANATPQAKDIVQIRELR